MYTCLAFIAKINVMCSVAKSTAYVAMIGCLNPGTYSDF